MRTALAATALGITLTTAGLVSCSGEGGPPISPGPVPSGTPVFASGEEALAAAEGVYREYLRVSNELGAGGWVETEPLNQIARGSVLEDDLVNAAEYREAGYRQIGDISFDSLSLQRYRAANQGDVMITIYVCADVSNVDVVDKEGKSIVPKDRPDRQPLEVEIDDKEVEFKVARSESWSGASFC